MYPDVSLPVLCENVDLLIREHEAVGFRETATFRSALRISSLYRRRGIGAFLVSGRPGILHANLRFSAQSFIGWTDRFGVKDVRLGALTPLFDAIGCGEEKAVAQFGRLVDTPWASDREYEEDYLFTLFCLVTSLRGTDASRTTDVLDRYRSVAAEVQDVRYDLCAALYERDASTYDSALEEYLMLQRVRFIALASTGRMQQEKVQTEAKVSVEGLALVRMGAREGLELSSNYPLVADLMVRGAEPSLS